MSNDPNFAERHPSFGMVQVNRVSSGGGSTLFQSDVTHHDYVVIRLSEAVRRRQSGRDHVMAEKAVMEVAMSFAQWAQLVSSFGTEGVSATIRFVRDVGEVEQVEHESRAAVAIAETRDAARKATEAIAAAVAEVERLFDAKAGRKELASALHTLRHRVGNTPSNMAYAGTVLAEHVERTVAHAKADIEAAVAVAAARHGINAGSLALNTQPVIDIAGQLETGTEA